MWDPLMVLLLLYTAFVVPFKISFIDDDPVGLAIIDYAVDILFAIDIFVNFNTGIIEGLPLSSVLIPGCARQYEGLGT